MLKMAKRRSTFPKFHSLGAVHEKVLPPMVCDSQLTEQVGDDGNNNDSYNGCGSPQQGS